MSISFEKESESGLGEALYLWWQELDGKTGDRAQLRRAKSVNEIILLPVFQKTCIRFEHFFRNENYWQVRFATIVGILAHVRVHKEDTNLPLLMAGKPKPMVSELRFKRLIQRNREELYPSLIRVVRIIGNTANIYDLSESLYYWGDRVKKKWSYEYYSNISSS